MIHILNKIDKEELTPSEKVLADYIENHPEKVIHQSLKEICEYLYISNATIVRFCQKIGYQGFNEFKFSLKSLIIESTDLNFPKENLFDKHLSIVKDYLFSIPFEKLTSISDLINKSSTLYIYGGDMSSIPAHYLHSVLSSLDYQSILIEWRHLLRGIAESANQDTLFFLIVSHGDQERYGEILEKLHEKNAIVVSICDETNPNMEKYSKIFINTEEHSMVLNNVNFNYKLSSLICIQILIDMIFSKN